MTFGCMRLFGSISIEIFWINWCVGKQIFKKIYILLYESNFIWVTIISQMNAWQVMDSGATCVLCSSVTRERLCAIRQMNHCHCISLFLYLFPSPSLISITINNLFHCDMYLHIRQILRSLSSFIDSFALPFILQFI